MPVKHPTNIGWDLKLHRAMVLDLIFAEVEEYSAIAGTLQIMFNLDSSDIADPQRANE